MKRQLMFLLVCVGLIIFGSGFFNNLNAQKRGGRTTSAKIRQEDGGKTPSPAKSAAVQRIRRETASAANSVKLGGDPCTMSVPIAVGQTLTGSLANGDCQLTEMDGSLTYIDFYSFNGTAGQPVSISMSSSNFDTYLLLVDPDGKVIEEDDDGGDGSNSRIPMDGGVVILPVTGQYIIGANSYNTATGAYSVTLNARDANCAATNLNYNQTVSGMLTSADCAVNFDGDVYYTDLYTFSGTAGQQITIRMSSTVVDSYLVLDTPSGANSVSDDDGGGGNDARIPASGTYTLPETGTYTIEATTYDAFDVGAYTLTLTGPTTQAPARTKFDFDGDGKADISVFRPDGGVWYILASQNGFTGAQFGASTDKIVPADYDGDGKTDLAVYRAGTWYLNRSTAGFTGVAFGASDDIPQPADFDGDGKADLAVWRPSSGTWYVYNLVNGQFTATQFGASTDKPVASDYDGDGKANYAVFRPSNGFWFIARPTGTASQNFDSIQLGIATDKPVPADYDGDGKTDVAVYRPSNGAWYLLQSTAGFTGVQFGISTDLPVAADYDGDGKADIAVYRSGVWYLLQTTAGFTGVQFGTATDKPAPNAFVP